MAFGLGASRPLLVRDSLKAVIIILVVTATELAVFVPFTYRHAKSPEEAEKQEAILLAEKREKVKRIWRNGRSAMVFKWLAERFTALWCAISPPASWRSSAKKVVPSDAWHFDSPRCEDWPHSFA